MGGDHTVALLALSDEIVRGRGTVDDTVLADARAAEVTDVEVAEIVGHLALNTLTNCPTTSLAPATSGLWSRRAATPDPALSRPGPLPLRSDCPQAPSRCPACSTAGLGGAPRTTTLTVSKQHGDENADDRPAVRWAPG